MASKSQFSSRNLLVFRMPNERKMRVQDERKETFHATFSGAGVCKALSCGWAPTSPP